MSEQITMTADIKTMALTDKLRFAKERIAELEQERDSLKEQVRVREERMEQLYARLRVADPKDPYHFGDLFDENGKVLDEKAGVEI